MNKDKTNQEIIEGFKRRNTRIIFSKKIDPDNIPAFNQAMAHNAAAPRLLGRKIAAKGDTYHNYIAKAAKKRKDQTPSPRIARKDNVTVSSALSRLNNSFNHGLDEGRYERLRAADIKRYGYTELAGRNDPKRAHVVNANTRKIARDRRLAGIVPGSANARPENRSDVLIHSARKSAEKRAAGKPSPRIAPKNRDRTIADSFNHGLEEGKLRNKRIQKKYPHTDLARQANIRTTERRNRLAGIVPGSFKVPAERAHVLKLSKQISNWKADGGRPHNRPKPKNRDRTIADSFNHGLEEAKRPTTRPIKSSKNIFGAGARGAVRGLTTPLPAGTSRTGHVLGQVVRNIARHVTDKFF